MDWREPESGDDASVSQGCWNKWPQTEWLKATEMCSETGVWNQSRGSDSSWRLSGSWLRAASRLPWLLATLGAPWPGPPPASASVFTWLLSVSLSRSVFIRTPITRIYHLNLGWSHLWIFTSSYILKDSLIQIRLEITFWKFCSASCFRVTIQPATDGNRRLCLRPWGHTWGPQIRLPKAFSSSAASGPGLGAPLPIFMKWCSEHY